MNQANSFKDLDVYRSAFAMQQKLFELSKTWPKTEAYSLTDQIRPSSRSVCANLAESWAKRRYPAHFLNKLTDADSELQETIHWIDTATACGYLSAGEQKNLLEELARVGRQLGRMVSRHESFCY